MFPSLSHALPQLQASYVVVKCNKKQMKTHWKNPPDEDKTHSFDDESFCLISNSWKWEILCVGFFILFCCFPFYFGKRRDNLHGIFNLNLLHPRSLQSFFFFHRRMENFFNKHRLLVLRSLNGWKTSKSLRKINFIKDTTQ